MPRMQRLCWQRKFIGHCIAQMAAASPSLMRPPPSGIEEYLKALTSKSADSKVQLQSQNQPQLQQQQQTVNMTSILQAETNKMQQLQMQKQQLQAQLGQIDQQLLKVQGGLEILKRMAGVR